MHFAFCMISSVFSDNHLQLRPSGDLSDVTNAQPERSWNSDESKNNDRDIESGQQRARTTKKSGPIQVPKPKTTQRPAT